MAPRINETETEFIQPDEATEDVLMVKPGEENGALHPILSSTTILCSNVFGTLFGKTKRCEHCQIKLVHSEERIKETVAVGEEENAKIFKTYFHPECKIAHVARQDEMKVVHKELLQYFRIRSEMARRAEMERLTAIREAQRLETERVAAERALSERLEVGPKQGFFSRVFGGCRNHKAVEAV